MPEGYQGQSPFAYQIRLGLSCACLKCLSLRHAPGRARTANLQFRRLYFLRKIVWLKPAYALDKQRHLARLKVFAQILDPNLSDFHLTRLYSVLTHDLDSIGRVPRNRLRVVVPNTG